MREWFDSKYSSSRSFNEKRDRNAKEIVEKVGPELRANGIDAMSFALDMEARVATGGEWINPASDEFRPPDVLGIAHGCHPDGGARTILIEIKDFPQTNMWLSTGFLLRHLRTYIAVQHWMQVPVYVLFRDDHEHESGGKDLADYAYESLYVKESNRGPLEYVLYGGLLFDLIVNPKCSMRPNDDQVLFHAQSGRRRGGPDERRLMKTLPEIVSDLRNGRVAKRRSDPRDLPLWNYIQREGARTSFKPLIEPANGLVHFVTEGP